MAFADLNPLGALWQRHGLHCLLLPEDAPAACSLCWERPLDAQPLPQKTLARPDAHGTRQTSGSLPARGKQESDGQGGRVPETGVRQREQREQTSVAVQPAHGRAASAQSQDVWRPLPPHVWPAPWQERLAATRPGLVLWTYWKLGRDLGGMRDQEHAARRTFLQRLLADLGHPGGTHTFWPACLPASSGLPAETPGNIRDAAALAPSDSGPETATPGRKGAALEDEALLAGNPDVFWSGVSRLGARGVVVMGSAAVKALALPGNLRPLQQTRHRGHLVWVLWDVDYLLHEDQRYAAMLAFLRRALRQVTRA